MAIVDIYGRPLKQETLRQPQTSKLGALFKEYAEHPAKGLIPAKLARILLDAERGNLKDQCELFQDMEERDAHLYADMSKRKRAILGLPWSVEPPSRASTQEKKDAAYANEILEDQDGLEDLFLDQANGIGYGFGASEIEWQQYGRDWLPKYFHYRPQSWFQLNPDNQDELRLREAGVPEGVPLNPFGWIIHRPRALSGYVARTGLFRVLAWPYLFKNYAITDLAEMLEIYGLPLRIGKYPTGTTDDEKTTLLRAVTGLGHSAAGIIPESMVIEFQQAAQGTSDPFLAMQSWADSAMSKAILGGTLTSQTSDSGGGSYALGEVHDKVRHDLLESDAKQLANTINNYLLWPLLALNRAGNNDIRRMPKFVFDTKQTEDIEKIAKAVPALVNVGLKISNSWVHERTGIPEPIEGEAVLQLQQSAAPAFLTAQPNKSLAILTQVGEGQQGIDKAANALKPKDINTEMVELLKPVYERLQALGDKASAEDFYEAVLDSYPDLDDSQLREMLANVIFATSVWGKLHGSE